MRSRKDNICALMVLFCCFCVSSYGQNTGGKESFMFLKSPYSARLSGLGGVHVSGNSDLMDHTYNPAALTDQMSGQAGIGFSPWLAGISHTQLAYAHNIPKAGGIWAAGLSYFDYGQQQGYDDGGNAQPNFSAQDYAFWITHARQSGNFRLAASLKTAVSQISNQSASALALDMGAMFVHPKQDFKVGLSARNIGFAVNNYGADSPRLPADLLLGTSYKPTHMPFRFSVSAQRLHQFDIVYNDPLQSQQIDENGVPIINKTTFGQKIGRRLVFGVEGVFSKNFNVRAGYNYMRRAEMRLESLSSAAGFSFGFMFKVRSFQFDYSYSLFHAAGRASQFSMVIDTKRLFDKKAGS